MGMMDAMKEKMDEEERKIIRDIVKALPLVPDQARRVLRRTHALWRPGGARACWATRAAALGVRWGRSGARASAQRTYIPEAVWRCAATARSERRACSAGVRARPRVACGVARAPAGAAGPSHGAKRDTRAPSAPWATRLARSAALRLSGGRFLRNTCRCGRGRSTPYRSAPAAASGTAPVPPTVRFLHASPFLSPAGSARSLPTGGACTLGRSTAGLTESTSRRS